MTEVTQLLGPETVMEMLGVTRGQLKTLPIPHYRLGKRLYRWNQKDVQDYIASKPRKLEILETEEIVSRAVPAPNESGIYFLLFKGEIVYVGQSICPLRRLGDHTADKGKFFDAYVFLKCDRRDLLALEGYYISKYQPKYNRIGILKNEPSPGEE